MLLQAGPQRRLRRAGLAALGVVAGVARGRRHRRARRARVQEVRRRRARRGQLCVHRRLCERLAQAAHVTRVPAPRSRGVSAWEPTRTAHVCAGRLNWRRHGVRSSQLRGVQRLRVWLSPAAARIADAPTAERAALCSHVMQQGAKQPPCQPSKLPRRAEARSSAREDRL